MSDVYSLEIIPFLFLMPREEAGCTACGARIYTHEALGFISLICTHEKRTQPSRREPVSRRLYHLGKCKSGVIKYYSLRGKNFEFSSVCVIGFSRIRPA